jgi:hypothetical protein
MKSSFKLMLCILVVLLFAFGHGWCGKKIQAKPGAVVQKKNQITVSSDVVKPAVVYRCPPGWQVKNSDSETFSCAPRCPQSFKCPEGWVKECLDCGVRCNKPVEPPK